MTCIVNIGIFSLLSFDFMMLFFMQRFIFMRQIYSLVAWETFPKVIFAFLLIKSLILLEFILVQELK